MTILGFSFYIEYTEVVALSFQAHSSKTCFSSIHSLSKFLKPLRALLVREGQLADTH